MKEQTVEICEDDKVIIEKLFGPLIFANLRVTPDFKSNLWIIEREWFNSGKWIEWCRIPGQIEEEFYEA
mgnify:CR=1 FL=1